MLKWLVVVVFLALNCFTRASAQPISPQCPATLNSVCTWTLPFPVVYEGRPKVTSNPYFLRAGWVIESAQLLPLKPNWAPYLSASVWYAPDRRLNAAASRSAVDQAIAAVRQQLSGRPLVTPTGDAFPGDPVDWVLRPWTAIRSDLRNLGRSPLPTILAVNAVFKGGCRTACRYTFGVKVTARFIAVVPQTAKPIWDQVNARLSTLPRRVQLTNRCERDHTVRVALYKELDSGLASRFSASVTVPAGRSIWIPSSSPSVPFGWLRDWIVTLEWPSAEAAAAVNGGSSGVRAVLWDGKNDVSVYVWPSQVQANRLALKLCP